MPTVNEAIKGRPLTGKPHGISRCGMSQAKFAKHCQTSQWYELAKDGQIIGAATDLDFYREVKEQILSIQSEAGEKEIAKV